jgi:hypothetical protein
MQDEARHVAFGRLSLGDYYPQLTQSERDEREIRERMQDIESVAGEE